MKLFKFYRSLILVALTISGSSAFAFPFFGIREAHALVEQLGTRADLTPPQLAAVLMLARVQPTSEMGHFVTRITRERGFKHATPFPGEPLISDIGDLLRKLSVWNQHDVRLLNGVVIAAFVFASVTIDDPDNNGISQLREIQNAIKPKGLNRDRPSESMFPEAVRKNAARALVQLRLMRTQGERPFADLIYGAPKALNSYVCLWELGR